MRVPLDAQIPREKLTQYLLIRRLSDDKSKFLRQAAFTDANPGELELAIRKLAASADAIDDGLNEYGTFFRVEGRMASN